MRSILSVLLAALAVAACQMGPQAVPVPDGYDWHFLTHGGSGDLDFGDGDWAGGTSLFHLSCLPGSGGVEMSWGEPGEAVLTAGTATGTFQADARVPVDHPVFAALRAGGTIAVGFGGSDLRLEAHPEGKAELERFFAYCSTPGTPRA